MRKPLWTMILGAVFMTAGVQAAEPLNLTGVWRGEVALANGQKLPFVARFTQHGAMLMGKMDGINGAPDVEIVDGKIESDKVTFSGVRQIQGAPVKFNYTGQVEDANTLAIQIVREDGEGAPLSTVTKRSAE